jgi:RimJ/RimL family protein N-acetyltransferase
VLTDHWPLRRVRLTTERLVLRMPGEDELADLADVAADGVHEVGARPFLTPWTDLPPAERARYVIQQHWSRLGAWTPESWALELGVFQNDRPVGLVALKARDFAVLREVRTESWLGLAHHGQGLGTEARTALLHLAFAELGAAAALSEVFQDNAGSQGVSRKLGYRPDGISRDALHGQVVVSDRLRLTREDWQQSNPKPVDVSGLDGCEAFFAA